MSTFDDTQTGDRVEITQYSRVVTVTAGRKVTGKDGRVMYWVSTTPGIYITRLNFIQIIRS